MVLLWLSALSACAVTDHPRPDDADAGSGDPDGGAGGTDGRPIDCALTVPDDTPTISEAILLALPPATVCVRAGSYSENLELRAGVSIHGLGGVVIAGSVGVSALPVDGSLATTVSDLVLAPEAGIAVISGCAPGDDLCASPIDMRGGRSFDLALKRLLVRSPGTYCANLVFLGGARVSITFEDSVCEAPRGIRLISQILEEPLDLQISVERNRFSHGLGGPMTDAVDVGLTGGSGGTLCGQFPAPAGTRAQVHIVNNEILDINYEGIYLVPCLDLSNDSGSTLTVANNTFVVAADTPPDRAYAIFNNGLPGYDPPLIVANNLYWRTAQPMRGAPPAVASSNLQPITDPFVDLAGGDLRLKPSSPAIDAADPAYAPATDIDGLVRPVDGNADQLALPDIGAHEHHTAGAQ